MNRGLRLAGARAAARAGAWTALRLRRDHRQWRKGDGSIVTSADLAAEDTIRSILTDSFGDEPVIGEERESSTRSGRPHWLVDPIDGTTNFARGIPVWATMVAWVEGDEAVCAAICAPELGAEWYAGAGGGAFRDEAAISVSDTADLTGSSIAVGGWHEYTRAGLDLLTELAMAAEVTWGFGNFWGHCLVAEGALDLALSVGTKPWDTAAPALVVREAGGRTSSLPTTGSPTVGSLLTGTPAVHAEASAAVARRSSMALAR